MFNTAGEMIPFFITATLLTVIFIFFLIVSLVRLKDRQMKKEHQLLHALIGEKERSMHAISIEIHDNINQMLSLARMTLKMIDKYAVPEQKKYIQESGNILDSAIGDLRNISHSLNADYLRNRGLYEALQEDVHWLNETKNISCFLDIEEIPKSFDKDTELMMIRIAQEAINNVLKHANAQQLNIHLKYGLDEFQMAIRDDGSGFNPDSQRAGVGLESINQRSRIIKGTINITSAPGSGTLILLTILDPVYA